MFLLDLMEILQSTDPVMFCSCFHFKGLGVTASGVFAMKFAQMAGLVTLLLHTFGEVTDLPDVQDGQCFATHFQEDCAGAGRLTMGVRMFHLLAARRDVL